MSLFHSVIYTAEEWKEKGHLFSRRGNYEHAAHCYNNANEPLLSRIANSCHLEKMAELIEEGTTARQQAFNVAANEFLACASITYWQSDKQRIFCSFRAGNCYGRAGMDTLGKEGLIETAFC